MKKIVVFGSINTDLVITTKRIPDNGETIKGDKFFSSQGGKGANQAVAAAKLGGNVKMIGCVGDDHFGENAIRALNTYGVNTDYIKTVENCASGTAIIIKVAADNRIIIDSGANKYLKALQLKNYFVNESVKDNIFITQLECDLNETTEALSLAKKAGMLTIFNPAPAVKLDENEFLNVDILILNQSETQILAGIYPNNQADCINAYQYFKKLGVKTVIITLGGKGSIILNDEQIKEIAGIKVKTVDTTGAGDAYIGALAFGLANNLSIYESAELANKVAALAVMKDGAQSAMPTIEEVEKIYKMEVKYD